MKKFLALGTGILLTAMLAACSSTATTNTDQTSSLDASAMMTDTGSIMNSDTGAMMDNGSQSSSTVMDGQD